MNKPANVKINSIGKSCRSRFTVIRSRLKKPKDEKQYPKCFNRRIIN